MIKIVAPKMACDVLERAMQIHGALGLSQDTVLPELYVYARTLRIADGPDQVHMMQLGRDYAAARLA
jgi:acyl-CoA dehydrogenase